MNPKDKNFAYVVNWQDTNEKIHQDEIVRFGFYEDDSRSWIHAWQNVNVGLKYFLNPLPKVNTVVYKLSESDLAQLRSMCIIIPESSLIEYAEEITKVK